MEYLIALIVGIALYMFFPCDILNKFTSHKDDELDGGFFGKKPKAVKKRTRKKVTRKPKTVKRKVVKRKTKRKTKK